MKLKLLVWCLILCVSGVCFLSSASAQSVPANLKKSESFLGFVAHTSIFDAEGKFGSWQVTGQVNPGQFEQSRVTVEVDVASVDTDSEGRDEHLRQDDFFAVKKYPKLTFVTSSVVPKGGGKYLVKGALTIKGNTRQEAMLVRVTKTKGGLLRVQGSLAVNRMLYGLTYKSGFFTPELRKLVDIKFDLKFVVL